MYQVSKIVNTFVVMKLKGRFAPSPSGRMHLGNIYSALLSWLSVKSRGGEWLLRIEDLDRQRCRREYAEQFEDDLLWLGLVWDEGGSRGGDCGPYYQSLRNNIYISELEKIRAKGLLYPCYCRRADILAARAPHATDGNVVYQGRCRHLSDAERQQLAAERQPATRIMVPDADVSFTDGHYGLQRANLVRDCGDFIVRRADGNFAYQLAVVVDDALMGVGEVVRGCDLISSTHQQIYLYQLLGYEVPKFAHLPLLVNANGQRLSKRDASTDMGYLRQHFTPERLLGFLAFKAKIIDSYTDISLSELLQVFDWGRIPHDDIKIEAE